VPAAGYVKGYADGTFQPNQPITRQEAAVIVASLLRLEPTDEEIVRQFRDAGDIAAWSRKAVAALVELGYMNGRTARSGRSSRSRGPKPSPCWTGRLP